MPHNSNRILLDDTKGVVGRKLGLQGTEDEESWSIFEMGLLFNSVFSRRT